MVSSLRAKITLVNVAVLAVTLLVLGMSTRGLVEQYFVRATSRSLVAQGQEIATLVAERGAERWTDRPGGRTPDERLETALQGLGELVQARVLLVDGQGRVVADSMPGRKLQVIPVGKELIRRALAAGRPREVVQEGPAGELSVAVAVPAVLREERGAILLFKPLSAVRQASREVLLVLYRAGAIAAAVTIGLLFMLTGQILGPLRALDALARRMAAGDFRARIDRPTTDEVGRLAATFNYMGEQLDALWQGLAAEKGKLEAVLAGLAEPVLALDEQGRILFHNPPAAELVDSVPAGVLGEDGRSVAGPLEIEAKGRIFLLRASEFELGEGKRGRVVVFNDVTELRRLEKIRRDLVSNVSHDLRTPITAIQGFVEALEDGVAADDDARRRYLRIIAQESSRLKRLVEDLFQFARLESGQIQLNRAHLDLGEVARRAVESLVPQASARGQSLVFRAGDEPCPVWGDGDRLGQVALNLIQNAIQYTPDGGRIDVSVLRSGREALLEVRDNGRGIPPTDLPHVFDRFYRVEKSRSRHEGGTGLGLAIARHIVEAHGGRIWAESKLGHGSTFRLALALADAGSNGSAT